MTEAKKTISVGPRIRSASDFAPNSLNTTEGTVAAIFATDTPVRSYDYNIGDYYEVLGFEPGMVRLDRFKTSAPILDNHQRWDDSLGTVTDANLKGKTLIGTLRFDLADEAGKKAFGKIERGFTKSVSIGYRVYNLRYIEDATDGIPVYMATDWEPMEISTAKIPADIKAAIRSNDNSQNQLTIEKTMKTEKTPAELEAERIAAEKEATRIAELNKNNSEEAVKAERTRVATITELASKHKMDADFTNKHIKDGTKVEEVRTLILDKIAEKQPAVKGGIRVIERYASDKERGEAMAEGICARISETKYPLPAERKENPFRHRTLMELCDDYLVEKGLPVDGSPRQRVSAALNYSQRDVGMSTSDLPNLFANVLHKILRKEYKFQTGKWKEFCYNQPGMRINQPEKSINLGDFQQMPKVSEGGEYLFQSVADTAESFTVNKFGNEFAITIEMIINDDLGGIERMGMKAAKADAFTEDYIIWALLQSNPNMSDGNPVFSNAHNNITSATALSAASIAALRLLMVTQTGMNGKPLDIEPKYIITGRANEATLNTILNPNLMPIKPTDAVQSYIKLLKPIYTNYIPDQRFYLAADPSDIDTIRWGGLVGEPDFTLENRYEMRRDAWVYHMKKFFGASYTDFRGLAYTPSV